MPPDQNPATPDELTPEGRRRWLAELAVTARTQGYDSIAEREAPAPPAKIVYDLERDGRIVATFLSLEALRRHLELRLGARQRDAADTD